MSTFGIGIRSVVFTLKYTVSFKKGTLFHKTPNVSSGMSVCMTEGVIWMLSLLPVSAQHFHCVVSHKLFRHS